MVEPVELESEKNDNPQEQKDSFIFFGSIFIAILYDFLFIDKIAGVSYPLFILGVYGLLYKKVKESLAKKYCFENLLMLVIGLLALTYLFFSNQVLRSINSILIPFLFVSHSLLLTETSRYEWSRIGFIKDVMKGMFVWPFEKIVKPFHVMQELLIKDNGRMKDSVTKKVITGIILSLPVLVLVIALLSSADLVFGNMMQQIFRNIEFGDIILHTLLIGFITITTFSFFWSATYSNRKKVPYINIEPKLDVISILTVLSLLNIVYGAFSYIQFAYLFGSIFNQLPDGFTYAEYARKGFFELIVVVIVNVAIVLVSLKYTKLAGGRTVQAFKILNCGLIMSTFIMLFSSFFRMYLYEEIYGYTYLRVFTHEFMLMLFFILGVTLYKVWSDKLNIAKWYIVISLISYVLINYINVDVFIAQKNMERYYKTGTIDVSYLSEMSHDTTVYIKELTNSPNPQISAEAQEYIDMRKNLLASEKNWQSYNLSKQRAFSILNQ
ncbi:DUF4153 domain-containing protein [Anaerosinus massiliensis]|uniref:DUF4153 domain-containing protein n=1 Tax=Massilibacillus massiliensis TaxID=1806837 RepID=UPI000AF16EF4|nr:DUF4173 domain-containing protein [Massilibacillus massiliensis]